jgi:hypothetical protein
MAEKHFTDADGSVSINLSEATERYNWGLTCAFDMLANSVRETDQRTFVEASSMMGSSYVSLMRGLSYMATALSRVPKDELIDSLHSTAFSTIAELTEFFSRLAEFDAEAELIRSVAAPNKFSDYLNESTKRLTDRSKS